MRVQHDIHSEPIINAVRKHATPSLTETRNSRNRGREEKGRVATMRPIEGKEKEKEEEVASRHWATHLFPGKLLVR